MSLHASRQTLHKNAARWQMLLPRCAATGRYVKAYSQSNRPQPALVELQPQSSHHSTLQHHKDAYQLSDVKQRTREIRARVCSQFLSGGLIYVSGGDLKHRNGADVFYKFRASSNFVYLTGVVEPGFACLLDPATQHFTLVAPRPPPDAELWSGGLPSLDVLAEEAGADACIYAEDLSHYLCQHHADAETLHVLEADLLDQQERLLSTNLGQHQQQQAQQFAALQAVHTQKPSLGFSTAFLEGTLNRCRAIKTDAEVACLLMASQGSAAAHKTLWSMCQPGVYEYQLEAAFVHECLRRGNMQLGYPCIVGAGRNGAILHYERNTAIVGPEDLVLVDAGAEHDCYTADITRTFPASGRYTPQQRDIYDLVLTMQQHALDALQPGLAWQEVQRSSRRLMLEGLQQLDLVAQGSVDGLLEAGVDKLFMPHGLGHFLGLDVHDVSDVGPVPQQLQEGHVVTVEPGVYFMPSLLARGKQDPVQAAGVNWGVVEQFLPLGGVRIEDNVVITAEGHFNLTTAAGLPKTASDVEAAMAQLKDSAGLHRGHMQLN